MARRSVFARMLDEKLQDTRTERDARQDAQEARARAVAPPHPLLFAAPFRPFRPSPYARVVPPSASHSSSPGGARATPGNSASARDAARWPIGAPVRPALQRQLSRSAQESLDALNALGAALTPDFTREELRSAFRALARRHHPDRHPGADPSVQTTLARTFRAVVHHQRQLARVLAREATGVSAAA